MNTERGTTEQGRPELRATERHERRYRLALRWGLGLSVVLHVLVFLLLRGERLPPTSYAAAGPDADDASAAGGGMRSVELRVVEPRPIPRPPEPVFVPDVEVEPVEEEENEVEPVDLAELDVLGTGQGEAEGQSEGELAAGGAGGGGSGEREGLRMIAPNPRSIIIPPTDAPRRARGRTISVYVFVNSAGRVVADSTRVIPSSGDRGFDRELRGRANEWMFEPARRDGRPVGAWFDYSFTVDEG